MSNVAIIGAGLAGSLLSIYLARRGINVDVYEARGDMRKEQVAAGRSINLALSDRGIAALREVGMDNYMLSEAVPMYGRMIHDMAGSTKLLPYSGRKGEFINSVSRSGLNIALIIEAEQQPGVQFVFNERCVDFDASTGEVVFASGRTRRGDTVIATDGAGSAVRHAMERRLTGFESSSIFLEHGYKELHIPPGHDGRFQLEENALHIWPRHQFMMIALPNSDGSFTCTLFMAHRGCEDGEAIRSFDRLTDEKAVTELFDAEFADALSVMPTLVEDFFENPTGELGTVRSWPWNVGGKALLLGDSAHAMVPFYGQGMNCAFEDVRILDSLIGKVDATENGLDWNTIFSEYGRLRKPNTDAIQVMAEENFYEMRDATADPVFQRKRELETRLENTFSDYFSKYSMVTFREDMAYAEAMRRGHAQDDLLMRLCSKTDDISTVDINELMTQVRLLDQQQ